MKKGLLIAGGIFIAVVFVGIICLYIFTNAMGGGKEFNLKGTWKVYMYAGDEIVNEIMVFDDDTVKDYRNGSDTPVFTSSYTYENGTLTLEDASMTFSVRKVTDYNVGLIEPSSREWKMIKIADENKGPEEVSPSAIKGTYSLLSVEGVAKINETIKFSDTTFTDYRNGEVYLDAEYTLNADRILSVPAISMNYYTYKINDRLLLIDRATLYVWELKFKG